MKNLLDPNALYWTDNGAILHGRCCGATAQASGRDLSGAAVVKITEAEAALFEAELGYDPTCEVCSVPCRVCRIPTDRFRTGGVLCEGCHEDAIERCKFAGRAAIEGVVAS